MIEAITLCAVTGLHNVGWQFPFNLLLTSLKGHCWIILVGEMKTEAEKDRE